MPAKHVHRRPQVIECRSRLKQVGLAFRVFSNDNDGKYPYFCPTNSAYGNDSNAWFYFYALSNELGSAKILTCPADRERLNNMCVDFSSNSIPPDFGLGFQQNKAVSYFVGLDADETKPQMLLSGDWNFVTNSSNLRGSVLMVASNLPVMWNASIHTNAGNVAFADGSVQQLNNLGLANYFRTAGIATNRLLLPLVP
ncbi:MAG: type II secretion system protein [Verrucomicrobia bacterium]|nr:type II secretion system protein [Verrucomicrobiota bacterium]